MSRCVLVTGAAQGIGRAVATAFASNGDRVAVHYFSQREAAQATVAGLPGAGHALVAGDISDPRQADSMVTAAVDALGAVDVLVNNAAVMIAHPLPETSFDDWQVAWRRTFDVNVFGAANVSHRVASHMIERGTGGRIVNIGSRGAFRGEPDHPAYGASKAALHALGQSLAVSLAPYGIAVASVAPGFVRTERVGDLLDGAEGVRIRSQSPFGRVGTPAEVAAAVMYLAAPEAVWASGAVLDLNGASYLRT